jgi:hypothetical protein
MFTEAQWDWLWFEGVIPLFGAGLLYLAWGCVRRVTATSWTSSSYTWKEAIDSMGWLYGALIIAVQSALKSAASTPPSAQLKWGCIIAAGFCALLLLSAMNERGQNPSWQPPPMLKGVAILLVLGILWVGCTVQGLKAKTQPSSVSVNVTPEKNATVDPNVEQKEKLLKSSVLPKNKTKHPKVRPQVSEATQTVPPIENAKPDLEKPTSQP